MLACGTASFAADIVSDGQSSFLNYSPRTLHYLGFRFYFSMLCVSVSASVYAFSALTLLVSAGNELPGNGSQTIGIVLLFIIAIQRAWNIVERTAYNI